MKNQEYISFDAHKKYTLVEHENKTTGTTRQCRLNHSRGVFVNYLTQHAQGEAVAVEATGNWYWIVNEIEEAGLRPLLVHPRKAKLMMGMINKTDKLDVHGLNQLQRTGTLPTVWIAPNPLRDQRELTRGRLVLTQQRTRLKNRLTATLGKHGFFFTKTDWFSDASLRNEWSEVLPQLPDNTRWMAQLFLRQLDFVNKQIVQQEKRLEKLIKISPEIELLMTLPGVGKILASTICLEIGMISRFPSAEKVASYGGCTPRVKSSGDKTRYGKLRPDINHYLRWALIEAANVIAMKHKNWPDRHVSKLYSRIALTRGHAKAVGAVARHLAEAIYWMLTKHEPYRDPALNKAVVPKPA